jgi:DDE superfamily endonuclease
MGLRHARRAAQERGLTTSLTLRLRRRPINGQCFRAYVEQQLVAALKPGNIVIMDNLCSHKSAAVRQMIQAAGTRLWFLPPYSTDLNPIGKPSPKSSTGCEPLRSDPSKKSDMNASPVKSRNRFPLNGGATVASVSY